MSHHLPYDVPPNPVLLAVPVGHGTNIAWDIKSPVRVSYVMSYVFRLIKSTTYSPHGTCPT
jgi:hypothetical protein